MIYNASCLLSPGLMSPLHNNLLIAINNYQTNAEPLLFEQKLESNECDATSTAEVLCKHKTFTKGRGVLLLSMLHKIIFHKIMRKVLLYHFLPCKLNTNQMGIIKN